MGNWLDVNVLSKIRNIRIRVVGCVKDNVFAFGSIDWELYSSGVVYRKLIISNGAQEKG